MRTPRDMRYIATDDQEKISIEINGLMWQAYRTGMADAYRQIRDYLIDQKINNKGNTADEVLQNLSDHIISKIEREGGGDFGWN